MVETEDTALATAHDALERIIEQATKNTELSQALRALALSILEALPEPTDTQTPSRMPPEGATDVWDDELLSEPVEERVEETVEAPVLAAEDLAALPERLPVAAALPANAPLPPTLEQLATRCDLKGKACGWLAAHGFTYDGAALAQRRQLIEAAKGADCYLWMFTEPWIDRYQTETFGRLAEAYHTTTLALTVWEELTDTAAEDEVVKALAEAQSCIRVMVTRIRGEENRVHVWFDEDQKAVFEQARHHAQRTDQYLPFMSLSEPADPDAIGSVKERLHTLLQEHHETRQRAEQERRLWQRLAYHANLIRRGSRQLPHDWRCIHETIGALFEAGVKPSDRRFGKPLEGLTPPPDGVDGDLEQVMRYLQGSQEEDRSRPRGTRADLPAEVVAARKLIAGKTVLLVGGDAKPEVIARLERVLRCRVVWLATTPNDNPIELGARVVRAEPQVVLLLIRWSRHSYAELAPVCKEAGIPLVRVPGGYGVNTLAKEIMAQAGNTLEGATDTPANATA